MSWLIFEFCDRPNQPRLPRSHLSQRREIQLHTEGIFNKGVEKSLIGIGGHSLFFKKDQDTLHLNLSDGAEQTIRIADQATLNVSPDGKALLWQTPFSALVVESQLWRVPVSGEAPRAANSQQLFAVGKVLRGELLQYDPAGQKWVSFLHGISAEYVDVSPDEKWVIYVSFPQGLLWRSKIDGTERLALSGPPLHAFGPRWSRDGKKIVFSDRGSGRPSKLYVVNSDGDGLHELLSEDNESKVDGTWTPDGKKIIFGNDFTSARPALHVLNLETKTREDVPGSAGLFSPRLSPSGRYLVALPVDCQKLLVYDFQKKGWTTLAEGNFTSPDWSPDENFVYGGGSDKGRPAVVRIRVADRTMEPVVYASGFPSTGSIGFWFGLGPGQSVIALHDTGIKDIYSLNWPRH